MDVEAEGGSIWDIKNLVKCQVVRREGKLSFGRTARSSGVQIWTICAVVALVFHFQRSEPARQRFRLYSRFLQLLLNFLL